jgi:hypothetical protein
VFPPVEIIILRGLMRRHAVALLFVLGCLAAGAAQAEQIRFPKTGTNAFLIDLPAGWTAKEDQYNGIQLLPADHRTSVYLSVVLDKQYEGKPIEELALAIGKPSQITRFSRREPAAISGRKGAAFYAQMKNASGAVLDVKMVIIPLAPALWATETLLSSQQLSAAQAAALKQAVNGIAVTTP